VEESGGLPTLEEASVKLFEDLDCRDFSCFGTALDGYLFRVVDLPDDGLPTRPMRGSRGILGWEYGEERGRIGELWKEWGLRLIFHIHNTNRH